MNGNLTTLPFAELLWRISQEKRTGTLHVKKADQQKSILFEGGDPIHAESNIPKETLEEFLVSEALLTADACNQLVEQSKAKKKPLFEFVMASKTLDAARLYEVAQKLLATRILDCFSWLEGEYSFEPCEQISEDIVPFKMNVPRLILKGFESYAPVPETRAVPYRLGDAIDSSAFKLTGEELRILQTFKTSKPPQSLMAEMNLSSETVSRRLAAFEILGLLAPAGLDTDRTLDELVKATLLESLKPVEPPPPVERRDPDVIKLANEIAQDHLKMTTLNYFELLGAAEGTSAVEIRDKFIEFATKYSPIRFRAPELGDFRARGEEIFLRGVKAFSILSDFDSKTKYQDKLKAERAKTGGEKKNSADYFKIKTVLLDADPQFQKGLRFLKDKNYAKAIEFFQYAADIDTMEPSYIAHIGWATFKLSPERNVKAAEEILRRALVMKPESAFAAYFLGKLLAESERTTEAIQHFKRAAELAPKNIDMVREARNVDKVKKG